MKRYKTGYKLAGYFLQGLLVGIVCFCLLGIRAMLGSSLDLSILGRNFEETDFFCETVETIVRSKIDYEMDRQLLETDGKYDGRKTIDIRQYVAGTMDEANQNLNTTYYLEDLISFAGDGAGQMRQRMDALLRDGASDARIGQGLEAASDTLETILPLSGNSLASYARLSSNAYAALIEYYRDLVDTSTGLGQRFSRYQSSLQAGEDEAKAPSNVLFYVENTETKQRYTNMNVKSLVAAHATADSDEDIKLIFEGERRYNIMVAAQEPVYPLAADWFMKTRFVGSGEKVLIAVDTGYAAGDELHDQWRLYTQRRPYLITLVSIGAVGLLACLVLFLISLTAAGIHSDDRKLRLHRFDAVPADLAAGLWIILGISGWLFGKRIVNELLSSRPLLNQIGKSMLVCAEYWLFLYVVLSILRRKRAGLLWKNTVIWSVVLGGRQVTEAARSSRRLLAIYIGFIVLNMIFLLIGGFPGLVMALALNVSALLYLMRDVVGNQTVRQGLRSIQEGNLDYRINTQVLTGQSREMGEAVNEMGEGLEKAVDSMLRNERLKSELITNVSHDLKTPLTSIVNYVDLLKREKLDNPRAREYVEILDSKTQRLRQLTEDLIEVSRINSGNVQMEMEPIALKQFVMQAAGEFEDRLLEKELDVVLNLPEKQVRIMADGAQLWRVFENLLGNICKYAKSGTKAKITLLEEEQENKGKQARIEFENTCAETITVSAQDLQERFVRGDSSRQTEGSGLGLSIAGSLTSLMGGSFDLVIEEDIFRAVLTFPVLED